MSSKKLFLLALLATSIISTAATISTKEPGNLFDGSKQVTIDLKSAQLPTEASYVYWAKFGSGSGKGSLNSKQIQALQSGTSVNLGLLDSGIWILELTEKFANRTEFSTFEFAVTPAPSSIEKEPYWGLMIVPYTGGANVVKAKELALNIRRLGAKWVRLCFWLDAYEKITIKPNSIEVKMDKYKTIVNALSEQGIQIMADFCQIPQQLSSRPNEKAQNSDAGPLFSRVKPRNYREWDMFVKYVVTLFGDKIDYYQIGNEPNIGGRYWSGTPIEYAEWVKNTSKAIREANSKVKIVASGFTVSEAPRENSITFLETLFTNGFADTFDIYSSHYSSANHIKVLEKYNKANVPRWNTEGHILFNFADLKLNYSRVAHFIHNHASPALQGHDVLTNRDLTVKPKGITYAMASSLLGNIEYVADNVSPLRDVYILKRSKGDLAVTTKTAITDYTKLGIAKIEVEPMQSGAKTVDLYDQMGVKHLLEIKDGIIEVPIRNYDAVVGLKSAKILEVIDPEMPKDPEQYYYNAREKGIYDMKAWNPTKPWNASAPPVKGHAAELEFMAPRDGDYEIFFDGTVTKRLDGARTISPFVWSVDKGALNLVDRALPSIWKKSGGYGAKANAPIPESEMFYADGKKLWQKLGDVHLKEGSHNFRLELVARRMAPDTAYCLEFEGILLRPIIPEKFDSAEIVTTKPTNAIEIPLFNGDFEIPPQKNPRQDIPGWQRTSNFTFVAGYNKKSSPLSLLLFPGTGAKIRIAQMLPIQKIEMLANHKLQVGDKVCAEVDVRHYWEEQGLAPELVAIGVGFCKDNDINSPMVFSRLEKILRTNQRIRATKVITQEDLDHGSYLGVILRSDVSDNVAKGTSAWDNVNLYIIPKK